MDKQTEMYSTYKSKRGEFECIYIVDYTEEEIADSFCAHNTTGSLQSYETYEMEYEIQNIECHIRYTEEDSENLVIHDYKPPKNELKFILEEISK